MADVFNAEFVSLHVRVTNKGAIHLYTQTLGYKYVNRAAPPRAMGSCAHARTCTCAAGHGGCALQHASLALLKTLLAGCTEVLLPC